MLCTALHIDDADLALNGGLLKGDMDDLPYVNYGIYTHGSFILFAEKIGIQTQIADKVLEEFTKAVPAATTMIERSFLSKESKKKYIKIIGERHKRFKLK